MPRAKKRARQKKNKAAKAALMSQQTNTQDVPNGNQVFSGTEDCCMAFSPTESPVYGGDELTVTVDNLDLPSEAEFFILYTGSKERRITRAQRINSATFQGNIPDHNLEEEVELDVFCKSEKDGNIDYKKVGNGLFCYFNDSVNSLAKKVLDINTDQEILKLEIENQDLSTLDTQLKKALEHILITEGWPGDFQGKEFTNHDTLLHFAAYHGLSQVVSLAVNKFSDEAIQATNTQGKTARELAIDQGHKEIADLLSTFSRSVTKSESMMFEWNGVVVHKNHNGDISIATPNIDGDTITSDMDLLSTIETEVMQKEQTKISQENILEEQEKTTSEDAEGNLIEENQVDDVSQDINNEEKEDNLKNSCVEEEGNDNETMAKEKVIENNDEKTTDNENASDDESDIVVNMTAEDTVPDEVPGCSIEDNAEILFEASMEKYAAEIAEEHDNDSESLLNEKLEILEEDFDDDNKTNQCQDEAVTDEIITSSDVIKDVDNSDIKIKVIAPELNPEPKQELGSDSELKDESQIVCGDDHKLETNEADSCYEEEVPVEELDSEDSEDEIIDYSQDASLSFINSSSLATVDTTSFGTALETAPTTEVEEELKTDKPVDSEDVPDSIATDTFSEDTSVLVSQEVSADYENQESTPAEELLLNEEIDSEMVGTEPVKFMLDNQSDESTDSDSSLPLPPSPPAISDEANTNLVDGSPSNQNTYLEEEVPLNKDSCLLDESSADEAVKSEPLSNGHVFQAPVSHNDRLFEGVDNSSSTGRIGTGLTSVAYDEMVLRKHNKDKVDLGPVMGEMCILDPLLEERETNEEPIGRPPMILRESIEAVRSISRHIQQLRSHGLGLVQHVKSETLQRYGSCPTLDIQGRCTPPKSNTNPEHHKSMLDLGPGSGHLFSSDIGDTVFSANHSSNIYSSDIYASDSNESGVRICINGVTVDSSEDHLPLFPSGGAASAASATGTTTSTARVSSIVAAFIKSTGDTSQLADNTDFSAATIATTSANTISSAIAASAAPVLGKGRDTAVAGAGGGHGDRSVFWYHRETKGHHRAPAESTQKNFWNHVKSTMASLGSKSHSLSSLAGADESDEDCYHDARENPTPSQSMMNLSMSPDSIYGNHRNNTSTAENMYIHNTLFNETNRPPSWPLPVRAEHQKIPCEILELSSKSPLGSDSADEFSSNAAPYSSLAQTSNQNITKSLSTSCIPAATNIDENKGAMSLMKRNNKKFRRQQEIEEIDEVAELNKEAIEPRKGREKKDLGILNEFLNSFPKDDKEKEKKEEKKRRSNVLSKLGSTRKKTKKVKDSKEKENKHKNTHQFVSLSISNTAPCHVCHKSMANKSAVQCGNCLVNVHESCKDQVGPCAKLMKDKVGETSSLEGTSYGQLREKQFASLPTPSSKTSDAMKRSSSVPIRPQSANPIYHQRHSLPNQGIAEENEDPEQQEHIHSNIGETISESMESLDEPSAESVDQIVLDNDPLLRIEDNELEAWSISVDKKVVKKLSSKEVKRQDNIYELIQTEKNYCRALTIMQKMFYEGLRDEVKVPVDLLNAMFPSLDVLLNSHKTFLHKLTILQSQHKDKIIEEIGKCLIEQFDGENAKTLKQAYGHFCSHHLEAADIYKEKKAERKFLSFIKLCTNNSICQKREIPDFLLLVTQRLTKYPTLVEAIIKNTKDKKERENLNKALELVKDILSSVNDQVEEYEREQRFSDIYNRTDARSSALFRSRKFKKSDFRLNHRKLIHDGVIGWKSARGKVIDVIAVVLTDLIVLMQENNQKFTFIMQDNKSCVIPLCELLVREKGDTKDGKGIYLITKKNTQPEMYEFVCKSTEDMKNWIVLLRSAVEQCPQEVVDNSAFQKLEVKRLMEMRAEKMSKLFESMAQIDTEIVRLCEEKKKNINEYVELYHYSTVDETNTSTALLAQSSAVASTTSTLSGTTTSITTSTASVPNTTTSSSSPSSSTTVSPPASGEKSQAKEDGPDTGDILQLAIDEITRLTKVFGSIGTCSTPFVGAGTEHLGSSTITHAAPKRAETFAGFDSLDLRKEPTHKRQLSYVHPDGRSSSMFNLNESEAWTAKNFKSATLHPDSTKMNYRKSAGYLHNMMAKNPPVEGVDAGQTVSWAGPVGSSEILPTSTQSSSVPSIPDATGSCASLGSTTAAITNTAERLSNAVQLSQFLHNFVQLSVQQSTALEGMRQQLMDAQDKIARLMTEKSEINKHSQLEGLRNLKEEVTRERQELEQEKKRTAESLEKNREEIQKEWNDIRAQKDELHRQREVFQKQYDLWEEHRSNGATGRSQNLPDKSHNLDAHGSNQNTASHSPIMHKRSASAELSSQTPEEYMSSGKDLKELSKQQQHRSSVGNLHHKSIPMHLFSATNEQRVGEKMKQHLPLQLASTGNAATLPTSGKGAPGMSQSQQSGLNRAGLGRSASSTSFNLSRESSSLGQVMKLAEPCRSAPKERSQTGMSKSDQNSQKQMYF